MNRSSSSLSSARTIYTVPVFNTASTTNDWESVFNSHSSSTESVPSYICSPVQAQHLPLIQSREIEPLTIDELQSLRISTPDVYNIWTFIHNEIFKDMFWIQSASEPLCDKDSPQPKHLVLVNCFEELFQKPTGLEEVLSTTYDDCATVLSYDHTYMTIQKETFTRYCVPRLRKHKCKLILALTLIISILFTSAAVIVLLHYLEQKDNKAVQIAIARTWSGTHGVNATSGLLFDIEASSLISIDNNFGQCSEDLPGFNAELTYTATCLCDSKYFMSGGGLFNSDHSHLILQNAIHVYDFETDQSEFFANMTMTRCLHTMSCVNDQSRLLICGGIFERTDDEHLTDTCEICDIGSKLCVQEDNLSMPYKVFGHTAVVTQKGDVVIGGGVNGNTSNPYASNYLFRLKLSDDYPQGGWRLMKSMHEYRFSPAMSLTKDQNLLICGGTDRDIVHHSCELIDINTGDHLPQVPKPMNHGRAFFCLVLYGDLIYAIGGASIRDQTRDTTGEVYDANTNIWTMLDIDFAGHPYFTNTAVVLRAR